MGTLVYDADCGFCTTAARWLTEHGSCEVRSWQSLDLAAIGLSAEEADAAAWWLDDRGRPAARGAQAIAAAARTCGPPTRLAGRTLQLRPVRPLAEIAYRWVARHRHQLPGGTAACRLD